MYHGGVTAPQPLGDELLGLVARLNRWATRQARLEAPPAQVRLLAQITELGPARIGDLAHADHTSQPTMTGQVRRLEENGWARRDPDPQDARATLITITPAGAEVLATARRSRAQTLRPVLDQLGEADRARLRDAVEVLRAVVDAATAPEPAVPQEPSPTRRLAPALASQPPPQPAQPSLRPSHPQPHRQTQK
jgi:DNA-binding MarR family transcriptional regulator